MSETTHEAPPVEALQTDDVVEAADVAVEATEATEAPLEEPQAEPEPEPAPKKPQGDRRFAIMTAKLKAEEQARQAAERERDAAIALAGASKDDPDRLAAPRREAPVDIEAAAAKLVAQREFDARRVSVIESGQKEFGSEWTEKTEILHGLGATSNEHFMSALVEMPNAAKIVAHLADDADLVVSLLGKSPTAMAAYMGRLDEQLSRPVARAVSNAPKPVRAITAPAAIVEANVYDDKMSMKEYAALRAKQAPRHLGGRGGK